MIRITLLFATICSLSCQEQQQIKEPQFPRHWMPPSLPKSTQVELVSRNMEFGIGSGSFRFHEHELTHFRDHGYTKGYLKPNEGSQMYDLMSSGAECHIFDDGAQTWIIVFDSRPASFVELPGGKFVDAYFKSTVN